MDTSSLISLGISGLLPDCLEIVEIMVPRAVVEELKEIGKFKDEEGKTARKALKLIEEGKIEKSKKYDDEKITPILSSDVDRGEAECFLLCLGEGINTLVMDDVDAGYALEGRAVARDIRLKISVTLVSELVRQGRITEKRTLKAVRKISEIREWEGGVLELLAKKYFEV